MIKVRFNAGAVNIIFAGLAASDFPMDKFLSLHLLKFGVATQQRAATLRLLQAVLVPQLSPTDSSPAAATPTTFTPNAQASANTLVQLTSDDQHSQLSTQRPEAREADSTTPEAAPGQQIVSTEAAQQCQQKLLARLLRAIPNVLASAVSDDALLAECGQQLVSQANAPTASEGCTQSVSDADLQTDVEAPQQAAQQDSEAAVIDGDAMHALLGLMLHAAGDPALKGMHALLEFPEALADAMSDLLASPQALPPILAPQWTSPYCHCCSPNAAGMHAWLVSSSRVTQKSYSCKVDRSYMHVSSIAVRQVA